MTTHAASFGSPFGAHYESHDRAFDAGASGRGSPRTTKVRSTNSEPPSGYMHCGCNPGEFCSIDTHRDCEAC